MQSAECKSDVFPCGASRFVKHKHTDVVWDTLRESLSGKDVGRSDSDTVASFVWSH